MKKDAQFGALDLLAYMADPAVRIFAWRGEKVVYIPGGTFTQDSCQAYMKESTKCFEVARGTFSMITAACRTATALRNSATTSSVSVWDAT
jgi:hypothetical protein